MALSFKDAFGAIKKYGKKLTSQQSPLEKKLDDALSNENWGVANSILYSLAEATFSYNDYPSIMERLWEAVNEKREKWRKTYKGLQLLDILLKFGVEKCADEARENMYKLRELSNLKLMEEGRDKASGIREKAQAICEILQNPERLKEERAKAREQRDKVSGRDFSSSHVNVERGFGNNPLKSTTNRASQGRGHSTLEESRAAGEQQRSEWRQRAEEKKFQSKLEEGPKKEQQSPPPRVKSKSPKSKPSRQDMDLLDFGNEPHGGGFKAPEEDPWGADFGAFTAAPGKSPQRNAKPEPSFPDPDFSEFVSAPPPQVSPKREDFGHFVAAPSPQGSPHHQPAQAPRQHGASPSSHPPRIQQAHPHIQQNHPYPAGLQQHSYPYYSGSPSHQPNPFDLSGGMRGADPFQQPPGYGGMGAHPSMQHQGASFGGWQGAGQFGGGAPSNHGHIAPSGYPPQQVQGPPPMLGFPPPNAMPYPGPAHPFPPAQLSPQFPPGSHMVHPVAYQQRQGVGPSSPSAQQGQKPEKSNNPFADLVDF